MRATLKRADERMCVHACSHMLDRRARADFFGVLKPSSLLRMVLVWQVLFLSVSDHRLSRRVARRKKHRLQPAEDVCAGRSLVHSLERGAVKLLCRSHNAKVLQGVVAPNIGRTLARDNIAAAAAFRVVLLLVCLLLMLLVLVFPPVVFWSPID